MRLDRGQKDAVGALKFGGQPAEPAVIVRQLHAIVSAAKQPLLDPTAGNLDDCRRRLETVAGELRTLLAGLPESEPKRKAALAEPMRALSAEIGRVAMLLDTAAAFHTGWMHMAARMVSGYTANGMPATPEPSRRVSLEV